MFAWVTAASAAHVDPSEAAVAFAKPHASHGARHSHGSGSSDLRHEHGFSCGPCKTLIGIALPPVDGIDAVAPVFARGVSDPFVGARERHGRTRGFLALPRGPPAAT